MTVRTETKEEGENPEATILDKLSKDALFSPYDITLVKQEGIADHAAKKEEKKYSFARNAHKAQGNDTEEWTYQDLLYTLENRMQPLRIV